ncbi:MAG: hypothetical protein J0H73_05980 [Salana multivorans]|uniref:hypothetical protein n=1 Tax=Salana multivorans TaxID=120377 RepID=UPI0009596A4F|nr:hypothetical protein [Salana multivorans]MBN8881848.1 hypothetical protein [Salana multivorans]OJX95354.1 MAG: hypothetical protein BGO96_10950 [Micrococcales bacterium 73-15]
MSNGAYDRWPGYAVPSSGGLRPPDDDRRRPFCSVAELPAAQAATLAELAQNAPGLADGAAVTPILVGLAEPAALVLPMG